MHLCPTTFDRSNDVDDNDDDDLYFTISVFRQKTENPYEK
jgi:hypothetical protein